MAILVTLTFFLAHAVPGGPAYAILGLKAHPASVAAVDVQLGLNVPLWQQYALWWRHLLHGNVGTSFRLNQDAGLVVAAYAGNTILLDTVGFFGGVALGCATGLVHGATMGRWPARVLGRLELAFYAMPSFFVATVLLMVFASWLHWLPAGGVFDLRAPHASALDRAIHMVLPALSLVLLGFAAFSRVLAQSLHTELHRDYVRTARARGLSETAILRHHTLPNALRPLVTLVGVGFPALFAGTVVVESVYSYPGLGWLLWRSALAHDYPVLIAIVLLVGATTIAFNLAADLINTWLDPAAVYV